MRAAEAPAKRLPGWLRLWAWVGFAALVLATCLVVTRWIMLGRGHARVQELANRHRAPRPPSAQPGGTSQAAGQPAAEATPARDPRKGTPIRELPLVGMAFSDDPALRKQFAELVEELKRIGKAISETREGGRVVSRSGHLIDFRTALENLGIAVPEGMTEAAAATEFLRHMEKLGGPLAQLRSALETGAWDWGTAPGLFASESDAPREQTGWMLRDAASVTVGLMQAHWRTGDSHAAWSDWETLHLLALRAGDDASFVGSIVQSSLQSRSARAVGVGISLDGWTDEQLARIPEWLATHDAVLSVHRGNVVEMERLEDLSRRPEDVRAFFEPSQGGFGLGSTLRRWSFDSASDQQLQDNLAVLIADYGHANAQLDLERRLYVPPVPGERSPSVEIVADRSPWTDFYFMPFKQLVSWDEDRAGFGLDADSVIRGQAITDHARLAAALEIQHRATGQYPDSLDAVGGLFPGGLPHDVATGQPYFYERTPDGAYRMWGTGIDQANNNGDPKKDILFALPQLPPP